MNNKQSAPVTKAAVGILAAINDGVSTTADLNVRGGRARALAMLEKGGLVRLEPTTVSHLRLTSEGRRVLLGKATAEARPNGRGSAASHRDGSAASIAAKVCERLWPQYKDGDLRRAQLIERVARAAGIKESSASTYIFNFGKTQR